MTQKSKFGGALAIGKKAIGKEVQSDAIASDVAPSPPAAEPVSVPAPPPAPAEPEPKPSLYTDEELKQVNAGGLKVAKAVRNHWMLQAHVKGVSVASIIKPALIAELGLPEGFTADNLSAPNEE